MRDEGTSAPPRRRWLIAVGIAMSVLLVGEFSARILEKELPQPLEWFNLEAQRKVERMDALASAGGADVVFVGSSMADFGFIPEAVTDAMGDGATAYNASLAAALPLLTEPWTVDVVIPRLQPDVLVIGLSSGDFADHAGNEAFRDAHLASLGGSRAAGTQSLLDRADHWMFQHSALWANRASLRDPETVVDALRRAPEPPEPIAVSVGADGRPVTAQDNNIDDNPVPYDLNASLWSMGTDNVAALRRLIEAVEARGVTVVLVDMPVTDQYATSHPNGAADVASYVDALSRLASEEGVPVVWLGSIRERELFIDPIHLNRLGAERLSSELGAELRELLNE